MYESEKKQEPVPFEELSEKASRVLWKHPAQKGIQYQMNLLFRVVEAFGVLKNDYKFQRFQLKEKNEGKTEDSFIMLGI